MTKLTSEMQNDTCLNGFLINTPITPQLLQARTAILAIKQSASAVLARNTAFIPNPQLNSNK